MYIWSIEILSRVGDIGDNSNSLSDSFNDGSSVNIAQETSSKMFFVGIWEYVIYRSYKHQYYNFIMLIFLCIKIDLSGGSFFQHLDAVLLYSW